MFNGVGKCANLKTNTHYMYLNLFALFLLLHLCLLFRETEMCSWSRVSVLTNQFIPCSTTNTKSSMDSKLEAGFYKIYRNTNKRKLSVSFARDNYKVRSIGVGD
ncbi:ankyrin repeat domain-containing protein EMB506 [Spatholobus suberectus]|nr:ankyrin repeat domain-containing protein EMB506 [Spatholobus suberectus]